MPDPDHPMEHPMFTLKPYLALLAALILALSGGSGAYAATPVAYAIRFYSPTCPPPAQRGRNNLIAAGTTIAPRWGARRAGSAPDSAQAFCSPL
jgi:hypothetical protein